MAVETILKQPFEAITRPVRFAGLATVTAIGAVSVVARGLVSGAEPLIAEAALTNGVVTVLLTDGSDGERYLVTIQAEGENSDSAEAELDVAVIDGAWAMPDGGTPYLTIVEFVESVGLPEVIALTDGSGEGRIDGAMLVRKLIDAQSIVDSHLAGRYMVPLANPPLIVKKYVTDLAWAALYPGGAPDGVAEERKQTLRALERLQAGTATIPAETPPAPAVTEQPVLISPGQRAYPDGLAGYANPQGSGWRW